MPKSKQPKTLIGILWSGVFTLVALPLSLTLPARAIILVDLFLYSLLIALGRLHGWFHAPVPIGKVPRIVLTLVLIAIPVGALTWFSWPPPSFVYVKPGVWLDPNTPQAMWMFIPVVRGPKALHNVKIIIDDLTKEKAYRRKLDVAKSNEERRKIIVAEGGLPTIHYDELDPSPKQGRDHDATRFLYPSGDSKQLHYDFIISFRGGDVRESLEMNSPMDQLDWQYKMKVVWNGHTEINCQDPRFSRGDDKTPDLPQCFPSFGGR